MNKFLSSYFGEEYKSVYENKWKVLKIEIGFYIENGLKIEGWCILYCKKTWNNLTLQNDARLRIFEILYQIDLQNGADVSNIVYLLCSYGAFKAVEVNEMF